MRLFNRWIQIDGEKFYLIIDKVYDSHILGKDYYKYKCYLYDREVKYWWQRMGLVYTYNTCWSDYFKYQGNLDKVIDELVTIYKEENREQEYISNTEQNFISKYEIKED